MSRRILKNGATIFALCLLGVIFLFPIYWTLITSFKLPRQIFTETPVFFLDTVYLDNYIEIFQKSDVAVFFLNSLAVSVGTTVISLFLATMAGFGLCRYQFRGNKALRNGIIVTRMIPALVYTIPFYVIYSKIHMLDTIMGLLLAYISFSLPLAIWLSINFFSDVPKEIYESAEIDGCSEYRLYFDIALPLVVSGMVVISILVFTSAWNEFGLALVLQSSDLKKTLPIGIASMVQTQKDTPSGSLAAAGMIAIIPAILISISTQKYIVKGIMAGAVKG